MIKIESTSEWYDLALVPIDALRRHEHHEASAVSTLCETITKAGFWSEPIIVERNDFIILDGHHRDEAARRLGLTHVPCALVTYDDEKVKVAPWREIETITHQSVRHAALTGELMPIKTSRHSFQMPIREERIPLQKLQKASHV